MTSDIFTKGIAFPSLQMNFFQKLSCLVQRILKFQIFPDLDKFKIANM